MSLSPVEAKTKCIAMWEHIRDNITSKEWRGKTIHDDYPLLAADAKWLAVVELYPGDSSLDPCYLCDYDMNCSDCPLDFCLDDDSPYMAFREAAYTAHYARASAAANRLVEKVRAWEVEG